MSADKFNRLAAARRRSRQLAMQALYQWQMTGQSPLEVEHWFNEDPEIGKADMDYFRQLLHQVPASLARLDAELVQHMDRTVESVDPIERALLRIACYELFERLDVPYRVVINEAVALAKKFGAEQSYRFVNGVLDKLAPRLRAQESSAAPLAG